MYVEVLVKTDNAIVQVCPFSQTPFNMCINQITTKCREEIKGIKISRNNDITKLMFADDRVTVADSEDAQQISIHKLENITYTDTRLYYQLTAQFYTCYIRSQFPQDGRDSGPKHVAVHTTHVKLFNKLVIQMPIYVIRSHTR